MFGTILMIVVWGAIFLWIGVILLKIAPPDGPNHGARPRKTERRWMIPGIGRAARRRRGQKAENQGPGAN